MVKLKIIIRSGALVLRISENKYRFYKNVEYLLKGSPNLRDWKADKEQFSGYSPFHDIKGRLYIPYHGRWEGEILYDQGLYL